MKIFDTNIIFNTLFIALFIVFIPSTAFVQEQMKEVISEHEKDTIDMTHVNSDLLEQLNDDERAWYVKFQEGMMFFSGWEEISKDILESLTPEKRPQTKKVLEALGIRIGTEWCKDNSIRKIDTDMLRSWGSQLKKAKKDGPEKLLEKIREVSDEVDQILNQKTKE